MPHLHYGASGSFGPVLVTVMLVFAALVYLRGRAPLRSNRLGRIPVWRTGSFVLGLFLIWVALASPLSALDHELLTVHMLKHLLLMNVAPPLIWLGEPILEWSQGLPRFMRQPRGVVFGWPVIIATIRIGKALARPEVCWLAATAALVGWHIPPVFALAAHSAGWHFVEQSSFLASGLLFWWPVVQPWPSVVRPDLSMILYLFLATLPCDILSGFLVFCDRVVYPVYLSSSHLFGFTALGDQQCGAALMWTCVTLVYLVAGTILAMRLLSTENSRDDEFVHPDLCVNSVPRRVQPGLEVF
jgi:putative membrane protein